MIKIQAIEEYQCSGCTGGPSPDECSQFNLAETGCSSHHPGTMGLSSGVFALGLPNGFNRFGHQPTTPIGVYDSYEAAVKIHPNLTTKFSLPIWKHLDEHGNTIVRWFSARTNAGWSTVILGDCRDKLPFAMEITAEDIAGMD